MNRLTALITIILINYVVGGSAHFGIFSDILENFTTLLEKYAIKPDYIFTSEDLLDYKRGLRNEDIDLNATQLITKYNYPVEVYTVKTKDEYLLTVVRIPNYGGKVVFIMHGLLSSMDDFVTVGPKSALPYLLHKLGYDVWLGNARGNKYSRNHVTLCPHSAKFWNFTWNEIGLYDLPAMIDFALNTTGQSDLVYVGHSQGTTAFFVMCSELECDNKISLMIALAPVAFVKHIISPIVRVLAPLTNQIQLLTRLIGINEFLPSKPFMHLVSKVFCPNVGLSVILCSNIIFTLFGFDYGQMNATDLPVIYGHIPAGTSTKSIIHYGQEVNSGYFRKFDYGKKNMIIYKTSEPPEYDVTKITVPVALYYGDNDWLAVYEDIKNLKNLLPNIVKIYRVPYEKFNHGDFLFAKCVKELLYDDVIALIQNNSNTGDA